MKNKKVLIIGPSWVGDMVMAQALFKLLQKNDPQLQIDVLAPEWSAPILQRMPEVTNCMVLPIKHGQLALRQRCAAAQSVKLQAYGQAIVLTNSWKSALIPWLARIPIRTGWLGELRWGLLNDVRYLNKKLLPQMVQRYVALGLPAKKNLPKFEAPKLTSSPTSITALIDKFQLSLQKPVLALCPGAAYGPAKRWPEEYYAKIAQQKIAAGWQVWLFGSKQDEPVIENIRQIIAQPTVSFAAAIDLLETVDLLSLSAAVVTNDSGLLHIAASLDKPLVAIYGSTSPKFTPPLGVKSQVLNEQLACSPCFARTCKFKHMDCMYLVTPDKVISALNHLEQI